MRVVIVTDSPISAEAIRRTLKYAPACQVLGFVDGRRPTALQLRESMPDVVLVDEMSSRADVIERVGEARRTLPQAKIVLLSACMDRERLAELTAAGIDAAVARSAAPGTIGILVREVAAGRVFHAFAPGAAPNRSAVAASGLTARELEILRLVAGGLSNGAIAARLWVTEQTVKFHLSNVYRKLGLANRTAAANYAHLNGLIPMNGAGDDAAGLRAVA